MLESDADRLESIRALDGRLCTHAGGTFWALFERPFVDLSAGGLDIESRSPMLHARSLDVAGLPKGTVLTIAGESQPLRIARPEPDQPAPGWTTLILKV